MEQPGSDPVAEIAGYLDQLARDIEAAPHVTDDPLSLTTVHLAGDLDVDDNGARETTRSVRLLRRRDGRLSFVPEIEIPGVPYHPPDPDLEWRA